MFDDDMPDLEEMLKPTPGDREKARRQYGQVLLVQREWKIKSEMTPVMCPDCGGGTGVNPSDEGGWFYSCLHPKCPVISIEHKDGVATIRYERPGWPKLV